MNPTANNSASTCGVLEAFVFGRDCALSGVWRAPETEPQRVWLFCPPWGEEDKSARRALTEAAQLLVSHGDAVLVFNYRGAGDSRGEFAAQRLDDWRADIHAAIEEIERRAPQAKVHLLGVRLGASLALQVLAEQKIDCEKVILVEPILGGKRFLSEMLMRQKLRGAITQNDAQNVGAATPASTCSASNDVFDLDGWPLSEAMRADLNALDLTNLVGEIGAANVHVFQIGAKNEVAPPLQKWCDARDFKVQAIVAQPFWNLLDHSPTFELWRTIFSLETAAVAPASTCRVDATQLQNGALILPNESGENLVATWHAAPNARATIVMLHGWSGYRPGPHQMLARAAQAFCAANYNVLRFDFAGRGDSDGDATIATLATMSRDTQSALKWARAQSEAPVLLLGMCSGCEVALGAIDPNIAGVALWSAPIFAATGSASRDNRKRARHLMVYARKLLQLSTYKRLLRGEVNARAVGQVVSSKGGESKNIESGEPGQLPRGWREKSLQRFANWNAQKAPLLLIYGSADPTTEEALAWYRNLAPHATTHLVAGANHSYYGLGWEREVIEMTRQWLEQVAP